MSFQKCRTTQTPFLARPCLQCSIFYLYQSSTNLRHLIRISYFEHCKSGRCVHSVMLHFRHSVIRFLDDKKNDAGPQISKGGRGQASQYFTTFLQVIPERCNWIYLAKSLKVWIENRIRQKERVTKFLNRKYQPQPQKFRMGCTNAITQRNVDVLCKTHVVDSLGVFEQQFMKLQYL